jgi:NAD(P)-dependent dehydrogenase (short-subunit alcohol dehydrogenase family)
MTIRFDDRVAIVTGAAAGLGRAHALGLAARGARVVVNDFGGDVHGSGASSAPAEAVAAEIRAAGGEAIAHGADVTNPAQVADMTAKAMETWGRIDVLINNAGILRDASFAKVTLDDFRKVLDVHLLGSVICTQAVWPHMRAANYGRVLMTTSSSGLYGNFGQSNYGAAKMGVIGLMNVLQIEGEKNNIRVNAIGPGAATRMTEGLITPDLLKLMTPEAVTPAALFLVSEDAPRRTILNATAGGFSRTLIHETEGVFVPEPERTPERIAELFDTLSDPTGEALYHSGSGQVQKFLGKAMAAS